ncbi:MAG: CDP-diacylglycerol--glycerol-3-phosphate 3-phosphatidyltransferase [FCB group bacterium]|nr:CDP-diacylglycerol--glycerol-3-phosphate 3-phosphatidyltransferase [FCB group bacterium]
MKSLPNILTILRILLTPVFIILLFSNRSGANLGALVVFVVASITDAYDGYLARKYDVVTPQGRFLDPLADKILVSSAFISFAILGIVEYWMVFLVIFRDLFVTGLRMAMEFKGFTLFTSKIAKVKTTVQIVIIIFILLLLGVRGIHNELVTIIIQTIRTYHIIYYFMLFVSLFTVYTGITYIYENRRSIGQFIR